MFYLDLIFQTKDEKKHLIGQKTLLMTEPFIP